MSQEDRLTGLVGYSGMKVPVRVATTAAITLSGEQTIDGVACVTDDRVLVKDQASSVDNGIYVVDTGAWSRAPDCDGPYDLRQGSVVYAYAGTANSGFWICTSTDPVDIDTDAITFSQASTVLAVVSAFMQTVLDDANAAAARTTLGAAASASPTFTGQASFPDGSAAAPSIRFTDDTDTGIYRLSANQIGFAASGVATFNVAAVTGGRAASVTNNTTGEFTQIGSRNTSDTAGASALIAPEVQGASSGDPYLRMGITGVRYWTLGIDNSDSDSLVISTDTTFVAPGTNNRFKINQDGAVILGSSGSVATGYGALGDLTLPATGKVRALNTAKAYAYITYSGGVPSVTGGGWNVGSLTDTGTGDVAVAITNALADANFTITYGIDVSAGIIRTKTRGTTSVSIEVFNSSFAAADINFNFMLMGN